MGAHHPRDDTHSGRWLGLMLLITVLLTALVLLSAPWRDMPVAPWPPTPAPGAPGLQVIEP